MNGLFTVAAIVGSVDAAYTNVSTTKCDAAVTPKTSANTKFTAAGTHGLADGNVVYYEMGTSGYTGGGLFDKTLYSVAAMSGDTYELKGIEADGTVATTGVRIPAWTAEDAFKLNKGKFTKVLSHKLITQTLSPGTPMSSTGAAGPALAGGDLKSYIRFQSTADWCTMRDQMQIIYRYKGVTDAGTAQGTALGADLAKGTSGLVEYTTYRCMISGTNTQFGLMPAAAATTTWNAAWDGSKTDATVLIPNTGAAVPAIAGTGANSLLMLKLAVNADTINKKTVCATSITADLHAKCAAVNGKTADKKQFWVSTKCDIGSDANCKTLDTLKPKWDNVANKCIASTSASSTTRVFASASIVALFGLIA